MPSSLIPDSSLRRRDSDVVVAVVVAVAVVACDGLGGGAHVLVAWHAAVHPPYAHHNPCHRRMPSSDQNLKHKNYFFFRFAKVPRI